MKKYGIEMFADNTNIANKRANTAKRPRKSASLLTSYCDDERLRSIIMHIDQGGFPCVGAKSALASDGLTMLTAGLITEASDSRRIHEAIVGMISSEDADAKGFRSLAVVFSGPGNFDEELFEIALWRKLDALLAEDRRQGYISAPGFSDDPVDPKFALSFGGRAFFAIGLHPNSSRKARRLPFPAIIFNPHDQFKKLRAERKYERMREVILARDMQFDGSPNPMVARHGEVSEARQYSGRAVTNDWVCPIASRDPQ